MIRLKSTKCPLHGFIKVELEYIIYTSMMDISLK